MTSVLKSAPSVDEAIELGLKELDIDRSDAEIEIIEEGSGGFLGLFGKKEALVRIGIKKEEDISSFVKDILYDDKDDKAPGDLKEDLVKDPVEQGQDQSQKTKDHREEVIVTQTYKEDPVQSPRDEENRPDFQAGKDQEEKEDRCETDFEIWQDQDLVVKAEEFLSRILDEMDLDYYLETHLNESRLEIQIQSYDPSELGIVIGKRGSTLDALTYLTSLVVNNHRDQYVRVDIDANNYRKKRISKLESIARKGADRVYKTGKPYSFEPMNSSDRRIIHMTLQDCEFIRTKSEGRDPFRKVVVYKKDLED